MSTIVAAELLSLPSLTNKDTQRIEDLFTTMTIAGVDLSVARLAALFRRKYRVGLADAVIAATAFLRDCPVATRNVKDFARIREIEIEKV